MKEDEFAERRKTFISFIKHEHEKILRDLEDITKQLWDGEKLISNYTEHGVEHGYRIIENILRVTKNAGTILEKDDYFILFASAFLHDIGMQCDLSINTNIYNKLKEKKLIEITFDNKAAEYTNKQKQVLRDIHNEITRYWMFLAYKKELKIMRTTDVNSLLSTVMHKIQDLKNGLIEDIADVCVYHTKRNIKEIEDKLQSRRKNNKKLLANIFRFSDELDFGSDRVEDYNAIQSFNIHEYSKFVYWYHKRINIDTDSDNNIIITGNIALKDADFFKKKLEKDIREKNKDIINYLNSKIRVSIIIDTKSPELAPEIPSKYKIHFEERIEKASFYYIDINKKNLIKNQADDFFNAMPPILENIHFSYDILRTEYVRGGGIKEVIENHIESNEIKLLAIKGRSGSGKSTVIKRMIYDYHEKYDIYEFIPHPLTLNISDEIKQLIKKSNKNIIFVFDNAVILKKYNIKPSDFLNMKKNKDQSILFIFSEQANQWNYLEKINELRRNSGNSLEEFSLGELDEIELENLVDKIIKLENNNTFKSIKSNLSKEKRLSLCRNADNKIIILLLLILRYGKNITSIIEEEYNTIPTDTGKNIYASICLLSELNVNFSTVSIRKRFNVTTPVDISKLRNSIDGLVQEKNEKYYPRHRELGKLLFRYIYQDTAQIKEDLILLFQNLDYHKSLDVNIFKQFLLSRNFKLISKLLKTEYAIKDFLEALLEISKNFDSGIQKRVYLLYSHIYRYIFKEIESSIIYLDKALEIDSNFALAIREKAWIYFTQGDEKNWTDEAKKASTKSEDINNLLQCAYLLSLGTMESFEYADSLYNKALKLNQEQVENNRNYKNYTDAKKVLEYIEIDDNDNDIPEHVLKELRPKAIYWKIKKGMNSQYQKALQGELSFALQNDQELELDGEIKGGKLLKALYKGYLARNLYLQWYRNYTDTINIDEIESLFTEALELHPTEIIVRSHYSTFIKEVKGLFPEAMKEINIAIEHSKKTKYEKFKNHPLLYNNKALILIDGFLKEKYPNEVLEEAEKLLKISIQRVEELQSNFYWPYESMEYLERVMRGEGGVRESNPK